MGQGVRSMNSQNLAKRFYKDVALSKINAGFHITLDGRILKTPGKLPLIITRQDRAEHVAAEWNAVETHINPSLMPCTRLMNVACEQTPQRREALIQEARNYAGTDLLCYRADAPEELVKRQSEGWDPLLDWAAAQGIVLQSTQGIIAMTQPDKSLDHMAEHASILDDVDLTLLVHFIATFGSAILGLAVMTRHIMAETALQLSRLDEIFQIEQWGEDEEAKARTAFIKTETLSLARLI